MNLSTKLLILSIFLIYAGLFSVNIVLAQAGSIQKIISVNVTSGASCNDNSICEPNLFENELNCFDDCGCNNDGTCQPLRGEDVNTCPNDCITPHGNGGGVPQAPPEELFIRNLRISDIKFNSANISWQTNKGSFCTTNLGKTSEYEKEIASETEMTVSHLLNVSDLVSSTSYHFNIICKTTNNLTVQTGDKYFTTPYVIADVTNFNAVAGKENISLSWENPTGPNLQLVKLVKNENFYPADINDGSVIYEGKGSSFVDKNVQAGKMYYYAIFAIGKNGSQSQGVLAFAKIQLTTNPVNPIVSANKEITITTISFFEKEINLPIENNKIIKVNQNTPVTISANCAEIPGAEKISINLKNNEKVPSSILKTESAEKSCSVSLVSPQNPGNYPIEISITDSKNRVIGQVSATLEVLGSKKLFLSMDLMTLMYLLVLVIFIFFIILFLSKKKKKRKHS